MENKSPSSSCVSPAPTSTMSAGESSWAMHIANFLASTPQDGIREMDDQHAAVSGGSSFSSGFSSSFHSFGDDASFITSELMCDDEEVEALQDTACSSAAGHQKVSKKILWLGLGLLFQTVEHIACLLTWLWTCCADSYHGTFRFEANVNHGCERFQHAPAHGMLAHLQLWHLVLQDGDYLPLVVLTPVFSWNTAGQILRSYGFKTAGYWRGSTSHQ